MKYTQAQYLVTVYFKNTLRKDASIEEFVEEVENIHVSGLHSSKASLISSTPEMNCPCDRCIAQEIADRRKL